MRCRRRGRIGDPHLDRTLRHPPGPQRDRAGCDGDDADANDPDHHRTPDVGRADDLGARASTTSVEPTTSATSAPTTAPPTSAEAPTTASEAAGTPAAAESGGLGALGWALLALLVVGLVAGWLLWRSRRRSAWDAQAVALEDDTRAVTGTQLPSVLTAEDAGQRALSWPPVRAALVDLTRRWGLLAEGASDDVRRDRAGQVRGLLQELVAAVEAENEALATGRDWRLLRPRVDEAGRALSAALAGGPQQQEPPFRET